MFRRTESLLALAVFIQVLSVVPAAPVPAVRVQCVAVLPAAGGGAADARQEEPDVQHFSSHR